MTDDFTTPALPPVLDHGAMLLNILLWHPEAYEQVRWLDPEHILNPVHARLYKATTSTILRVGDASGTVIPETQKLLLRHLPNGHPIIRAFMDLVTVDGGIVSSAAYHAEALFQQSRREVLRQAIARSEQAYREMADFTDLVAFLRDQWDATLGLASQAAGFDIIEGLMTVPEFTKGSGKSYNWVIPGLLEHQERIIVVAPVKAGKSVLSRQVCLALALGRHPLWIDQEIPRKRTLLVDLENPGGIVRRGLDQQQQSLGYLSEESEDAWIWHRPAGIDLGDSHDRLALERAIDITGADLVALCPLYKAHGSHDKDWESQAATVTGPLDHLREKYGCALWIEAHGSKSSPGGLFGSSRWERWYDAKVFLSPEDSDAPPPYPTLMWEATYREEHRLRPTQLDRAQGGGMAWIARFPRAFTDMLNAANEVR
jgi:hypothetical protein